MDKIIIVYYLNVDGLSPEDVARFCSETARSLEKKFGSNQYTNIILPVRNRETRVDCINPKLISAEEYKNVEEILKRNEQIVNMVLKSELGRLGEELEFEQINK